MFVIFMGIKSQGVIIDNARYEVAFTQINYTYY